MKALPVVARSISVCRLSLLAPLLLAPGFGQTPAAEPAPAAAAEIPARPNLVVIYADDLGYGDIGANGATTIPTPNIDALAAGGLNFSDGHCAASTCTPSRFSLLTGRYPLRQPGTGIATGDAPMILPADRPTLPGVLAQAGYATAVFGKWHLGMGAGNPDWNQPVAPGANERGFAYSFIMPATQDRVPTVYVENGRVLGLRPEDPLRVSYQFPPDPAVFTEPTGRSNPERLVMGVSADGHQGSLLDGIGRIGFQQGGHAARWQDHSLSDTFCRRAQLWIEAQAQAGQPFFVYYAATEPHCPRTPNPRFAGMTPHGPRGDAIVQFDWQVGEIVAALERAGVRNNTLIVISSDNGPVLDDGYADQAEELNGDHRPAGPWRGGKYTLLEGGTRVPFIVSWPGVVAPGRSEALVCQTDFLPSFAALAGSPLPAVEFDGVDLSAALLGRAATGREELLVQSNGPARLGLRQGQWKYIEGERGGNRPATAGAQLYDLSADPHEDRNLAAAQPDRVAAMQARIDALRAAPAAAADPLR